MHSDKSFSPVLHIFTFVLFAVNLFYAGWIQAQEKIIIGLLPEMNVFSQVQRFQPLADYLSKETGITIKLSILNRYSYIIDELRLNKVDAAFLGSFTAAFAISELGATPVARPVNPDNTSTYYGLIFTRKDNDIRTVEDMRGKSMAFVDRATTAGYIFPLAWLKENGVDDYSTFFREFFFTGSHDSAVDFVLNKKADIGAAKNTIYAHYLTANPRAREELVIIARSERVPSNGLCVTKTVSKEAVAKLQTALVGLDKSADGKKVLQKLHALRFVETDPADYVPVLELMKKAGGSFESFLNEIESK